MNNAYRFVLQCPSGHSINLERKCTKEWLSETEAREIVGEVELCCQKLRCGWHGKASKARLVQILPFHWILSPIEQFVR
jgi:hypothetical protein